MKVEEKGHTVTIKDTHGNSADFLQKVTTEYNTFKNKNLVLDLSHDGALTLNGLLGFLQLSNKHRKNKKSFVLVVSDFDFNEVPDEMVVVPTVLEAHDIIEMEEIERDLGF
ncbi:ribonuclease Z [Flavobacterium zepuense]|uniref:Ribonuclease Z n=1 Tax=Flavobacterium zepuense TaxID=2593302 RepID=A0A552V1E5_9FLAO|nr:ribonuclease Z [Flavobacterium zepuense]TRW24296.1 ribonuclease Z [Flavobacterium zepuense]